MTPAEALDLPISQLAAALKSRRVKAIALAEEALERLEKRGRPLNAVAALLPERARAEAAAADRELDAGRWRGPLHGVPYGAKDLVSAKGAETTWGTSIFAGRVIDSDAAVVRKLSEAGAVLVAKLSMVQLAGGFGYHRAAASLQGPGRNPWDPTKWAGGSSSGSGAAVAAGCVPFAIGSETWGSILTPSALCGIVGLRPTFGRVSREGAMALAYSMDKLGPIARRAACALEVLRAICGHDPRDPSTLPGQPAVGSLPSALDAASLRVGLFLPESLRAKDPAVFDAYRAVADACGKLCKLEVLQHPAPDLPADQAASLTVSVEEATAFEDLIDAGKLVALQSTDGQATARADRGIAAVDYLRAQRVRGLLRAAWARTFAKVDAVLSPALGLLAAVAPGIDEDLDAALDSPDPIGAAGNLLGLPALSLPGPLVRGLPTGMQLVGPAFSEEKLCSLGAALEAATPWAAQRPPTR